MERLDETDDKEEVQELDRCCRCKITSYKNGKIVCKSVSEVEGEDEE